MSKKMIKHPGSMLHLDVPKIAQSGADHSRTIKEVEKQHINEALNTTIGWRMSVTALLV